jgi:hypothetical protein
MAQRSVAEAGRVRLGTIYAAHGASHGFVLVLPAVLVALRAEFGASFTTLGTIATLSAMLYGLGALPAGLLADRVGAPGAAAGVRRGVGGLLRPGGARPRDLVARRGAGAAGRRRGPLPPLRPRRGHPERAGRRARARPPRRLGQRRPKRSRCKIACDPSRSSYVRGFVLGLSTTCPMASASMLRLVSMASCCSLVSPWRARATFAWNSGDGGGKHEGKSPHRSPQV